MERIASAAAVRPAMLILGESAQRGFALRFALLATAMLAAPWAISMFDLLGVLQYLVPGSVAAILALTFWRRPAEALLGLALFMLFRETIALHVDGTIRQVDEMSVGLIFLIAAARAWRSWRAWMWLPRDLTVAAVLGFGVVSSLAAGVPFGTWAMAFVLLGKGIAFLYVVLWTEFRQWELRAAMSITLAVGAIVLMLGVIELADPPAFRQFFGLNQFGQARGELPVVKSLFVHPVIFGWFTAFIALFAYAQFLITRHWQWLAVALAFSIGPFLSARRRAMLALAAGLAAALLDSLRSLRHPMAIIRTWWPVTAGAVLLVVLFMPGLAVLYELTVERYVPPRTEPTVPAPVSRTPSPTVDAEAPPQARIALYVGSVEVARDYFPLGAGLGRYASWMSRVDYSPLYEEYGLSTIHGLRPQNPVYVTDTFWPQVLGELGLFGLVAYLGFLGSLGLMLWRELARDDGPMLRVIGLGAGMVFVQAIVESLASPMFHSPPRVYLLYLAVGVVASGAWRRTRSAAPAGEASGHYRWPRDHPEDGRGS